MAHDLNHYRITPVNATAGNSLSFATVLNHMIAWPGFYGNPNSSGLTNSGQITMTNLADSTRIEETTGQETNTNERSYHHPHKQSGDTTNCAFGHGSDCGSTYVMGHWGGYSNVLWGYTPDDPADCYVWFQPSAPSGWSTTGFSTPLDWNMMNHARGEACYELNGGDWGTIGKALTLTSGLAEDGSDKKERLSIFQGDGWGFTGEYPDLFNNGDHTIMMWVYEKDSTGVNPSEWDGTGWVFARAYQYPHYGITFHSNQYHAKLRIDGNTVYDCYLTNPGKNEWVHLTLEYHRNSQLRFTMRTRMGSSDVVTTTSRTVSHDSAAGHYTSQTVLGNNMKYNSANQPNGFNGGFGPCKIFHGILDSTVQSWDYLAGLQSQGFNYANTSSPPPPPPPIG